MNFVPFELWFFVYHINKYICGCGQPHLDMPKIIANIKCAICQDWTELWCKFCTYG